MPLQEQALIRRIRQRGTRGGAVVKGIGDDCAVLRVPPRQELLVTTDLMIENIHFKLAWHTPESVGQRCLTRGLSDIAAMGGEPLACFVSLALRKDVPQPWVDGFFRGLLLWSAKFNTPLAGGDTAESLSGVYADIVVVGAVPRGKAILRSGARPGDGIYVTGSLGGSAAAITALAAGRAKSLARHGFQPIPRVAIGAWLRKKGIASAMIDVSDGLSTDLGHICDESGVGAEIEVSAIPRARVSGRVVPLEMALHGGEDYELLFTSRKQVPSTIAGIHVTRIGEITLRKGMRLCGAGGRLCELPVRGWEHFRK